MTAGSVFERQNRPDALRLGRAFRRRYAIARRWRLLRVGGGLVIGTVGVVLAMIEPSTGEYISAIAAAWIVLSRTVLDRHERGERRCGAIAQELFDTEVFVLPWSASAVGTR